MGRKLWRCIGLNKQDKKLKSQVISFYSYRGGTGKSTVASNLAIISSKKYKTILVDLDLYSPQLTYIFEKKSTNYINDYLHSSLFTSKPTSSRIESLDEVICESSLNNLDLILANPKMSLTDNTILHDEIITKKIFPCFQHMIELLKTQYEVIILDCPGELNYYTLNGIAVADRAVAVSIPTIANVKGMIELLQIFSSALKDKKTDIILMMITPRSSKRKNEKLDNWKQELEKYSVENYICFDYSENLAYRHQFEDDFFYLPEEEEYQKLEEYLTEILK